MTLISYLYHSLSRLVVYPCVLGLLLASSIESSNASEKNFILTAQQWNIPRSASSILGMQALQDAMRAFQSTENNRLLIKYPGGDEGTLWAYELRGWLVSLGVASDHIELIPGSGNPEQLEIMVIKPN